MEIQSPDTTNKIRELNDRFRMTFVGGAVMLTSTVANLSNEVRRVLMERVRDFTGFSEDNDPHQEHDFGSVELFGEKYFFKLDYYDKTMEAGSEDPSDPALTRRVLTIMRSDEY